MDLMDLKVILKEHVKWNSGEGGKRANLSRADLSGADLSGADLSGADLFRADLSGADLSGADLSRADLSWANLSRADLSWANLSRADLSRADLSRANLSRANLSQTVLDPQNVPNQKIDGFEKEGEWVIGYRTRITSAAGRVLVDDRIYGCEVFSTCEKTECHPGWYLWPTLQMAQGFSGGKTEFIKVKARIKDMHGVGGKFRSRAIWVIGKERK